MVFFGILIVLASIILGFFVLIQNPKGGGLSGTFGGFGNQVMGVKRTTDVLEKGTWILGGILGLLCVASPAFIPKEGSSSGPDLLKSAPTSIPQPKQQSAPATTVPMPGTAAPSTTTP